MKKRWTKTLLTLLTPVIVIAAIMGYRSIPSVAAKRTLSNAGLAPLPESACELKTWHWSSPFSGEDFLKFKASCEDIEQFLASSRSLNGEKCEHYSAQHMRIPYPEDYGKKAEHSNSAHEFFQPSPSAPDWYIETLRGPGRRFGFGPGNGYAYLEVIIDDETGTVFVKLMFS